MERAKNELSAATASEAEGTSHWKWRLSSTPESVESSRVTVLSLLETAAAMTAYAWIAVNHGTTHLAIACCVAPLMLLRTPRSIATGLLWWDRVYPKNFTLEWVMKLFAVVNTPIFLVVIAFLSANGIDTNRAVLAAVVVTLPLSFAVLAIGVRIVATVAACVRAPLDTIRAIPQNWFRITACTDLALPPELIPGAIARSKNLRSDDVSFLLPLTTMALLARAVNHAGAQALLAPRQSVMDSALRLLLLPLLAVLGLLFAVAFGLLVLVPWLFRLSIKGTSIVYFPMVLFVWDAKKTKPKHITASLAAQGLFTGSCAILLVAVCRAVEKAMGLRLPPLDWYQSVVAAAAANRTAAAFFPANAFPAWQVATAVGAGIVFAGFLYAGRLKSRGYKERQRQVLEFAYALLGIAAVALILSLIFVAATLALAKP